MEITDTRAMTVEQVPLAALVPSPFNPRGKYSRDPEKLKELSADIAVHGVQQAILVRPDGAGKYEIVFGTRRAEASRMAGKETIPAVVREMSAEEALTLAMVENLQRADIHFMDEAAGFKKLLSGGVAPKVVGEMVGKPEVYVHLRMALNNLNPKWTENAYKGTLLLGSALYLARLTPGAQMEAWKELSQYGKEDDGHFSFHHRPGMSVLEPSAGRGDLADHVNVSGVRLVCIEQDPKLVRALHERFGHQENSKRASVTILEGNFLTYSCQPNYDRVLMNPPFIRLSEITHILHAWDCLKPGGWIVSVASSSITFRLEPRAVAFREFVESHGRIEEIPQGSFKKSGTRVNCVLVILNKRAS